MSNTIQKRLPNRFSTTVLKQDESAVSLDVPTLNEK